MLDCWTVGLLDWLKLRNALRESRWTIRLHRWARWSESPGLRGQSGRDRKTAIAVDRLLIPLWNSKLSHVVTTELSLFKNEHHHFAQKMKNEDHQNHRILRRIVQNQVLRACSKSPIFTDHSMFMSQVCHRHATVCGCLIPLPSEISVSAQPMASRAEIPWHPLASRGSASRRCFWNHKWNWRARCFSKPHKVMRSFPETRYDESWLTQLYVDDTWPNWTSVTLPLLGIIAFRFYPVTDTVCHYIVLYMSLYLSLYVIMCHYMSLYVIICHYMSLCMVGHAMSVIKRTSLWILPSLSSTQRMLSPSRASCLGPIHRDSFQLEEPNGA